MIIFLHVPKAAGSTMRPILEGFFDDDEVFVVKDDIPGDRRRFEVMSDAAKRNVQLVFGHISYGWHEMVPDDVDCRYVTILREPFSRVQSMHNYIVRSVNHFLGPEVHDMSLVEFMNSGVHCAVDNGMVRQLCGADHFYNRDGGREPYNDSYVPYGEVTHVHLKAAMDNLSNCWMVGTLDTFDVFLKCLCTSLGRDIPWFSVLNRTPNSQRRPLTCDERVAIAMYNRLDCRLYEHAVEISREIAPRLRQ